jgi:hypothetical protein
MSARILIELQQLAGSIPRGDHDLFHKYSGLAEFLLATDDISSSTGTIRAYVLMKRTPDEARVPDFDQMREAALAADVESVVRVFKVDDPMTRAARRRLLVRLIGELAAAGEVGQARNALVTLIGVAAEAGSDESVQRADEVGDVISRYPLALGNVARMPIGQTIDILRWSPRQVPRMLYVVTSVIEALDKGEGFDGAEARVVRELAERSTLLPDEIAARLRAVLEAKYISRHDVLISAAFTQDAAQALISPALITRFVDSLSLDSVR